MDFMEYCIAGDLTVRDAMKKLDVVRLKILFVLEGGVFAATLTDGDIRRFLLNGGKIDGKVREAANNHPVIANTYEQARILYHERDYIAIPIVGEDGSLENVYVGGRIKERHTKKINIPVVINAGGKGTRLDPYTRILPKPLIPVGELPIIELIMRQFQEYGGEKFHIIVNYKKELMKAYFADADYSYDISWYDEEKPLGTGGGLSLLKNKINETFFFTSCDTLLMTDYAGILEFHKKNNNDITMVCAYKTIIIPYGVLEMGKDGSIENIQEKPELSFLTNTGVYIVEPKVIDDLEEDLSIGFPDIVEIQRNKGRKAAIYPISENDWMDMGQISELEKMKERLEKQ